MEAINIQNNNMMTLKELLDDIENRFSSHEMFRYWGEEHTVQKSVSYAEFHKQATKLGAWLLEKGYEHRHIAIISENSYDWFLLFFAITTSGNTAVLINKSMPVDAMASLLKFNDVMCAFVSDDYVSNVEPACQDGNIIVLRDSQITEICTSDIVSQDAMERYQRYTVAGEDCAVIAFTSGTTGVQKGVMLTHWNIASDALECSKSFPGGGTFLSGLPLFHMFGLTPPIGFFLWGSTVVINQSPRYLLADIASSRPRTVSIVPALLPMLHKLYSQMPSEKRRYIICGGAAIDPSWTAIFNQHNVSFCAGYGMTECSPVIALQEEGKEYDGFMRIFDIFSVKIDEPNDKGVGEILIRGNGVTSGYYHLPQETMDVLKDGWLHTGDLGLIRDDKYLSVVGRKKNLLVLSNGENVSPEVVEQYVSTVSGVKECVASLSEEGLLQLEVNAQEGIEANVKEQVSKYNRTCIPAARVMNVLFRKEDFPRNATGKIIRGIKK